MNKSTTTVSEPMIDLPSSIAASLPSYLNSSSSSAVTTKCEVIEDSGSMSIDMHEAASLPSSDSSSSSAVTAKSDVTEKQDSMSADMYDSESSDYDNDYLDDGDRSGYSDEEIRVAPRKVHCTPVQPFSWMPLPKISPDLQEVLDKYLVEVVESEGFDIIDIPAPLLKYPELQDHTYGCVDTDDEDVINMAKAAIDDYNKKSHTGFEVVEIVKANLELLGTYSLYYITFVVEMDGDGAPVSKTFQAKVSYDDMDDDPKLEIDLCRVAEKRGSGI